MKKTYKIICLTDHLEHSTENSVYELVKTLSRNEKCEFIHVASRGTSFNQSFFYHYTSLQLKVRKVDESFVYQEDSTLWDDDLITATLTDYDVVLLRLPRPVPDGFFSFLIGNFPEEYIINRPSAIEETGSKAFLMEVKELCPPIRICTTIGDIEAFNQQFPVVLKPFEGYGGKGILLVKDGKVYNGDKPVYSFGEFKERYTRNPISYLAMKYLPGVDQGDKRIIVAGKYIVGASLRKPAVGSWMCNVSQGGTSHYSEPEPEEIFIAKKLSKILLPKGIIVFGFDTLIDEDHNRKLSEINTSSVGGLVQAERLSGNPVVTWVANVIWEYVVGVHL